MQWCHLAFSSFTHFSINAARSLPLTSIKHSFIFGWLLSSSSKFLHIESWSHRLQSVTPSFRAQILILQLGSPPPFLQPGQKGIACIAVSPLINSSKLKLFGAHVSSWLLLFLASVSNFSANFYMVPLPPVQLPHQIPQKPIWFLTFSNGSIVNLQAFWRIT